MTSVSSAKRTLESSVTPSDNAAITSARLVRLLEPGGDRVTRKGLVMGVRVRSDIGEKGTGDGEQGTGRKTG